MNKVLCGFLVLAIAIVYGWSLEFREEIQKMIRKVIRPWRAPVLEQEHEAWVKGLSEEEREAFDQALDDPLGKKED